MADRTIKILAYKSYVYHFIIVNEHFSNIKEQQKPAKTQNKSNKQNLQKTPKWPLEKKIYEVHAVGVGSGACLVCGVLCRPRDALLLDRHDGRLNHAPQAAQQMRRGAITRL